MAQGSESMQSAALFPKLVSKWRREKNQYQHSELICFCIFVPSKRVTYSSYCNWLQLLHSGASLPGAGAALGSAVPPRRIPARAEPPGPARAFVRSFRGW